MGDAALQTEIEGLVQRAINSGSTVAAAWITQTVMLAHGNVAGSDADWLIANARRHVRASVQKVISRYKASEQDGDPQMVLEGFERLQKAYLIEREGDQLIVPITQMTAPELMARAFEYRRMAAGCEEHAREIERYVEDMPSGVNAA